MVSSSGSDTTTLLLGRYRVEATLGEGSFGTVVRAFDTRLKRTVAIKTLKRSLAASDLDQFRGLEERFAREAEAGSRMGIHPNLVTVHDLVIEPDHTQYLILEYVRGGTLAERLREGALPLSAALSIIADIARGLQAAHDVGVVHRDIKPANIFLTPDGRAQVGDFGIAQIDDVSGRTHATVRHPGTPLYMSPEQAQTTGYVRPASDQYSLGLVLFEMLTGKAYKRVGERGARELLIAYPPAIAGLVEDMTATDPDDRLPSCADVIREVQAIARAQGLTETQLAVEGAEHAARVTTPIPPGLAIDGHGAVAPPGVPLSPDQPTLSRATDGTRPLPDLTVQSGPVPVSSVPPFGVASSGSMPADPSAVSTRGPIGAESRPRRRALVAGVIAVLLAIIGTAFIFARQGATPPPAVTATAPPATIATTAPLQTPTTVPTATLAPSSTPGPTAAPTTAPTATVVPTALPTPTAVPPTVAPASAIAVFSVGTTDQQLDTVSGDDVKPSFSVGQDVYGFVNFGGALAGKDVLEMTLVKNGAPQSPQRFTLDKSDGFLVFPLGTLDVADYQLIVSYGGKIAKTWDFKVTAPAPTPAPRAPIATPRPSNGGGGSTNPVQPTAVVQPTAAPATARPTTVIRPTIPPTQPLPTS